MKILINKSRKFYILSKFLCPLHQLEDHNYFDTTSFNTILACHPKGDDGEDKYSLETIAIIPEVVLGVHILKIKQSIFSTQYNFVPQHNLVQFIVWSNVFSS